VRDAESDDPPAKDADPGGPPAEEPSSSLDETLSSAALPESVPCPFCDGEDTEQFSAFGSAASTSQYYCRSCRSVFEFMKRR